MNAPIARVGGMDVASTEDFVKATSMLNAPRRERAYTRIWSAIEQGVEPAMWDAVDAKALRDNARPDDRIAIPVALAELRKGQTRERALRPDIRTRLERVQEKLSRVQTNVRDWLEICLAGSDVRDGIELKILPEDIVEEFHPTSRKLLLETVFRFDPNIIRPTVSYDGLTVSSPNAHETPLLPAQWSRSAVPLESIVMSLAADGLLTTDATDALRGQSRAVKEDMSARWIAYVQAPETASQPTFLQLWGMGKPFVSSKTKSEIEAEGRAEYQRRAAEWVRTLREGFRRNRLKGFLS